MVPKKNKRVVFLLTIHRKREKDEETGKEEINAFYNSQKGGVASHDQMCSFYSAAKKTNRWPMRAIYGMIDSAAMNALVIFIENVLKYSFETVDKRNKFLKEVAVAMITSYQNQRLDVNQTPKDGKQIMRSCGILRAPSDVPGDTSSVIR